MQTLKSNKDLIDDLAWKLKKAEEEASGEREDEACIRRARGQLVCQWGLIGEYRALLRGIQVRLELHASLF